ncbi:ABC-type transport auxiliary lipoprotein family protein [Aromatoleum petrolei]|uniref:ABC-type transport auxiliary lipoprotein component domain-containing protein n=1 Tax=Aromatoleum petrolei TaxID=76116 RepID=A0ABX1MI09_9RHOO|nr:ABC-type transport auxiliary lipoprotein family protein [Aromatoleum petrolei]NMF87574.1 hypothetical protein [Aromatoleum petrolei]QTQ38671.1 ABC transporter related [Aromatoleum petrolei]
MTFRNWKRGVRILAALCAGLALGACGGLPQRSAVPAIYDLGVAEAASPAPAILPSKIEVRAPSWLATSAMQYRLEYRQPAQRQMFSESRWAAPPAEMLQRRLLQALSAPSSTGGGCRLRLEIDEFTQAFDAPEASAAVINARAELLPPRGENAVARRTFAMREPAPSADARGGVTAFRRAGERLANEIGHWGDGIGAGVCGR